MAAFSGASISIGGSPAPSGGTPTPTPTPSTGGGKAFAGASLNIGAKPAPVATSSPTPVVPSARVPAPVVPKSTGGFFSKALGFVGNEIGKASDFISKVTSAPSPGSLGTNAGANTLKYLPSELARAIPGVAELQDNPEEAQYVTPSVVAHAIPTALTQTAKGITSMPVKAVEDVYDAGRVFLGKKPNASLNLPVLGKVNSDVYDAVDRINNGEDPVSAALSSGASSIFNVLFFADLANRVGGTRVTKTGEYQGDFNTINPELKVNNPGPKTGRLYEPKTAYNRGGAQVLTPEALIEMKSQGVPFGKNYDPQSPTFFRVTQGKGGAYTAEVMQLKPSYLSSAYSKLFGTKTAPTSVPELLGAGGTNNTELSSIASEAKPGDVITLHSKTVTGTELKDAVATQVKEATPEIPIQHPAVPMAAAAFTPISHTVMHNVLRLGGADTEQAKKGAEILHTEIQKHLAEDGELMTHTALMEKLGVDSHTATKLINQARPAPQLPAALKPKAFGGKEVTPMLEGSLTKYDTPKIIKARAEAAAIPSTHEITTPERQNMRDAIVKSVYGEGAAKKEHRLDIVSGIPAAGKSSNVAEPLAKLHGALIADSDIIKEHLPEFAGGKGAMAVHQESAVMNMQVLRQAMKNGDNIVFPTVMNNVETMHRFLAIAKEHGYNIHLHHVTLPVEEAVTRAVGRFDKTGRLVDPNYIVNEVGSRPDQNYDIIKSHEDILTHRKLSTDVKRGEKPTLLEEGNKPGHERVPDGIHGLDGRRDTEGSKQLRDASSSGGSGRTQKERVADAVAEGPLSIKEVAELTDILEPNVRRILGVGTKEGTFERVREGVYVLKTAAGNYAYVEMGDAVTSLARMAEEGLKFDSVILDPAYYSRALIGGNRGLKGKETKKGGWNQFIQPPEFAKVMSSVAQLMKTDDSHVYLMLSGARTAQPDMNKYVKGATDAGFQAVGEGAYHKLAKSGKEHVNMRGAPTAAERIILLTKSGTARDGEIPASLEFRFVRPSIVKGYQTEKPAELLKALIEQSTLKGETVLDPFAGSGVTGAEALKTHRNAVLIEKQKSSIEDFTKPRVEAAAKDIKKPKALPTFKGFDDLSTNILEKLKGHSTVSKEFVSNLTNSPDLKQAEKVLIRSLLKGEGDKVNVPEFAAKVRAELLPLSVNDKGEGLIRRQKARSELENMGIKIEQDMDGSGYPVNADGDHIEYDDLDVHTQNLLDTAMGEAETYQEAFSPNRYENVNLPDELRGPVANYSEKIYQSPVATSAGDVHFGSDAPNYFGHTRIEDLPSTSAKEAMDNAYKNKDATGGVPADIHNSYKDSGTTRRVIEVQSDLFQKGRLDRELIGGDGPLKEILKKERGLDKLEPYKNNASHFRMIREEVKQAAKDGKTKLQFPTGETAMKIEGLGSESRFQLVKESLANDSEVLATKDNIKPGLEVIPANGHESWIITDVLGDGKFKAVQKHFYDTALEGMRGESGNMLANSKEALAREAETFDISGKVDTENPIYKFYEKEVGRYLKNKYDAKLITDPQGVKWWEVDVSPEEATKPVLAFGGAPRPMQRGFINPGAIAQDFAHGVEQVTEFVEHAQKTTALTGTVNDAIYQHEGARKAMRQRAIQLLQEQGDRLTAEQWEKLYHYDENSDEHITAEEKQIYKEVIMPLKDALTKARDEYRELGGHITTDLQMEMTPRYAKEKGGPIDKALRAIKEKSKERLGVANGGLLSKSVGGGAKSRIFHALVDAEGNRTVVSIPYAKASRVTAFRKNVLTDLGPKSGKEGKTFTDENGKEYTIEQATTKEIEAHTKTRYHKNVLANYILAFDRTQNALSALKLLERIKETPEFGEIIVKDNPEEAPPLGWKDLSGVLPQFRGYYAEPKLYEALKDLALRLTGHEPMPVVDEINNLLTALIVLNPIMHMPNVLQGWATGTAAEGAIPGISKGSSKNFARAFNEVKNKGPLYLHYLEHGAPLMALKNTAREFSDAVLNQYSEEVDRNPTQWEELSKKLGYANPATWFKGFMHLNETITWGGNDIMFLQAMLDHADRTGSTPEEAIRFVSKRMADYRLPSRIGPGKFGRAVSRALQSRGLFLFSRYHYSGVIKPWIESVKDSAGPKSSWQQRRQGLRALAYLGLMSLLVYPEIDKLIRGISGSKLSYMTMAGPTKLVQNVEKLTQNGASGVPQFLAGTFTPSPAVTAAIELGFNVDLYTRDPIYSNPQNEGLGGFITSMVAPLSAGSRLTPGDFALSLFGIYTPKSSSGKNALNAQKYDELPLLQVQVKKDIIAGNMAKADAEMKDFNDRAIANYNQAMLASGGTPLPPDGSQNDAFLKEWGIKAPGQKALSDAAKLYGDGSLTSKSSLVDRVATYSKAFGVNPVKAFELLFTGQQIVKVDNFSVFGADSAIIVQRMSLSASSKIKEGDASALGDTTLNGLQLDHVIPLEAGGTNSKNNLNLITTQQDGGEQQQVEDTIGAAVRAGTISQEHAREYIIRYKAAVPGETLPQAYMNEYKNTYFGQPITLREIQDLIASGKAK